MDYTTYQANNGVLEVTEFDSIAPKVEILFDTILAGILPYWEIQNLVNYDINFDDLKALQIDYIASVGGEAALNGESDLNIKEVTTGAFKVSRAGNNISNLNGIPLQPMLLINIKSKLRIAGIMNRGII